jgi:hypothetical protein
MKQLLIALLASASILSTAQAEYTFIVPQKPGGGTSVWTSVVAKQLEKFLGEEIVIRHLPGANDIPGFNKFHNELRFDDKTVMVSHGGNGESYLVDNVDYDYYQYDPIGMMNLTIVNGHRTDADPYTDTIKFAAGSGMDPDMMSHLLMIAGPNLTVAKAIDVFNNNYRYIKGMSGGDRRLAYQRGELNVVRESTAAYNKHHMNKDYSQVWYSHGVFNLKTGKVEADPNYPGQSFSEVFKAKWGVEPSGEFYDAYILIRNFRDVMQKALWVNKGNPNTEKLRAAFRAMAADPESMAAIYKSTGKYDWIIGEDMVSALDVLRSQIKPATLRNLVDFLQATGKPAVLKENLIK